MSAPVLELVAVTKTFPGVVALDGVDFDLRPGEVHGLVGENGAGKSTLINVLSGVLKPDAGEIRIDGQVTPISDPVDARRRGVVTVHQEAELFPTLSIAENMALAHGLPVARLGFVDWNRVGDLARRAIRHVDRRIDVTTRADRLSVAQRHMTQVAAAIAQQARVVILDEPTSALSAAEADWLFQQIDELKAGGAAVVYISHRHDEIFQLTDRLSVLRDGRHVWTGPTKDIDGDRLVELMVDRGRQDHRDDGRRTPDRNVLAEPKSPSREEAVSLLSSVVTTVWGRLHSPIWSVGRAADGEGPALPEPSARPSPREGEIPVAQRLKCGTTSEAGGADATASGEGTRPVSGPAGPTLPTGRGSSEAHFQTSPVRTNGGPESHDSDAPLRLRLTDVSDRAGRVRNVSLSVHAGEIVGLYGLVGAGRTEVAQLVFGLNAVASGTIEVDGRQMLIDTPTDAVRCGIAYLPEDRLRQGVCRSLSVRANAVLASLERWSRGPFVSSRREREQTNDIVDRLDIRLNSIDRPIGVLSGGNQQKTALGRWLLTDPKVLILDEPTRGIDIAAKAEIHRHLGELARDGRAIVLIASELPEVLTHSDRVIVFCDGTVTGEFDPAECSAEEVAAAALPGSPRRESPAGPAVDSPPVDGMTESVDARRTSFTMGRYLPSPSDAGLAVVVLVLFFVLMFTGGGALSGVLNLLTYTPVWALLGLAAAIVIVGGGIDISVGAILALSAVCAGRVLQLDWSPAVTIPLALAIGPLVGTVCGLMNAGISLAGRVHPIVVTLGTMTIYRGLVILILGGQSLTGLPAEFGRMTLDPATGFRGIACLAGLIVVVAAVWLTSLRSGRHLYAFGASPVAARLAGISHRRVWLTAFAAGGALAGLAGVLELSLHGQMQAKLGAGWELQAIAIAVIGGVSITGGRGSVAGVLLAAILLRLVNSILVRWDVSGARIDLVVGSLLLGAVIADLAWRRRSR